MVVRLGQLAVWIAVVMAMMMAVLALASTIVALFMFAFVVHNLVFQIGLADWSSLGVGALFVAIIGGVWLLGNSLLDIIAGSGSRSRHQASNQRTKITLPWLGIAACLGLLFFLFAE
jgi:hypothetical protein